MKTQNWNEILLRKALSLYLIEERRKADCNLSCTMGDKHYNSSDFFF